MDAIPDDEAGPENREEMPTAHIFWLGATLMTFWPVLGAIVQPLEFALPYLLFFVGAFFLLFEEPLDALETFFSDFPGPWDAITAVTIIGLMGAMWLTMLFLPFFGTWNHRRAPLFLWVAQFSYAGAQTICGIFFIKANL